jgi:polysaccharide export outer membrane protein
LYNYLFRKVSSHTPARQVLSNLMRGTGIAGLTLGLLVLTSGCRAPAQFDELGKKKDASAAAPVSSPPARVAASPASTSSPAAESLVLHEGDRVRISFPGSPSLDTIQQIRRDGQIALPIVGEFPAAGMTPSAMEKRLIELYGPQLVVKEVSVVVENSYFPVYVTGAVMKPGKIIYDRPVTALEVVMEAGVDYNKANLKAVVVIRQQNGRVQRFVLNLKRVLQGQQAEPFIMRSADIIFVPERFSWF